MSRRSDEAPLRARIPADVEREDRVAFGLTWRQLVILTVIGLLLYAAWTALATVVPPPVFLVCALPIAGSAFFLAVGRRDGISLDRWLLNAGTAPACPAPARPGRRPNHPSPSVGVHHAGAG